MLYINQLNLTLHRGETFDRTCTWWKTLHVTPRNLAGYAMRFQVRPMPGGSILLDLSTGTGISFVDAPNGVFRIVASSALTGALTYTGNARFDLKVTDPGGTVSYPWEGVMVIKDAVTP